MCEYNEENVKRDLRNCKKNDCMDERTFKLFFWVMIITFVILALRPTIWIIGSGNGNGSGSGDGNNVLRSAK